jgi:hypothetical protein
MGDSSQSAACPLDFTAGQRSCTINKAVIARVLLWHAIAHFFELALMLQINAEKMRDREGTIFGQE